MSIPDISHPELELSELLGRVASELDIPRTRRIFVNRNLRMEGIELIGFDMDYTIGIYNQAEMERLSIELTLKKLVQRRGYPAGIQELDYDPSWAIRGLVVDRVHGNVFKMDRHGHVGRVFHGRRMLNREERTALYRKERIRLSAPRYAWIDTLFALPEAVTYLRLTDYLEQAGRARFFPQLWQDVRECIDEAHRDDSLKSAVRANPGKYFVVDPDLPAALHKLRSSGKRLFLLTNSLWDYTDVVMRFLLDGKLAAYPTWRSYFDILIVGGAKPAFFTDRNPFVEIDPHSGKVIGEPKGALQRGHVYQAGNLGDFEKLAGSGGDRVLYIGDHIYGDILRAKKSSVWRTCMIVQELENELRVSELLAEKIQLQSELDRKRRNLDAEIDFQQLLLKSLQKLADEGKNGSATFLDAAKRHAKKTLDELRSALRGVTAELDKLEEELDRSYNPNWGPIFKEGNENSRFGSQVEDYACLYTGRASNFLAYSPLRYFRAPRDKMPHEL
ncbi:MAG: HAD-IG family 5'-nucleotidase [Deltaproteobacteria bacterium]|nr:HAD-IG family 5'-nucleotidase [Deltaproteobacteria bacterium]